MKYRAFVYMLCMIMSVPLLADWSETGIWVSNNDNDSLLGINFEPDGTLFLALRKGEEVAIVVANWDYKPENCWTDKIEKVDRNTLTKETIDSGNLLILTANGECCLDTERVGDNLILSKVWVEGDEPLIYEFCADYVLSRN